MKRRTLLAGLLALPLAPKVALAKMVKPLPPVPTNLPPIGTILPFIGSTRADGAIVLTYRVYAGIGILGQPIWYPFPDAKAQSLLKRLSGISWKGPIDLGSRAWHA